MHPDAGQPSDPPPAATAAEAVDSATTLEQFLDGIGARAFRFAELGLRQREDALDAVQDTRMRMLVYRQRPHAEWTPLFWRILRRRIVDLQRRHALQLRFIAPSRRREGGADIDWREGVADQSSDPGTTHDLRASCSRVAAALSALPRRQREAFALRVLEELSVEDTARAMGCSAGSVKTHLSRARSALRQQLDDGTPGARR